MKTSLVRKIALVVFLPPLSVWILLRAVFYRLISLAGRSRPHEGTDFDVICISHVDWMQHIWQRNHHTMSRLAEKRKVLYCYPVTAHVGIKHPAMMFPLAHKRFGNLVFCKILRLSGENHFAWIKALNEFITRTEIKRLAHRYGLKRPILWFYFPFLEYLPGQLDELLTVYDIQDDYSAFAWASTKLAATEKTMLHKADIVFTGTHALYEKNKPFKENIHFFPCGVEFKHFSQQDPSKVPPDIKDVKPPILGYFGLIDNRIDADLLKHLAERHSDWNLFMIGPVDKNVFQKVDRKNVYFVGRKDYKQLPYYLQKFDVSLMPFAINEITKKINPTKTLEYFSARKPVVSSAIPDMIKYYSDIIGIAHTHQEFEELCDRAIRSPESFNLEKGLEAAKKTSWASIIQSMESLIKQEIEKKYSRKGA